MGAVMESRSRQLLGASTRRSRERDAADDELPEIRRRDPGKSWDRGNVDPAVWRRAVVGKLSRADAGLDWMTPGQALAYADSISRPRIDRRAERDGAIDDGALAATFRFIDGAGGGQPLPDELRRRLELRLGVDLSRVRVHTDERAAAAAATLDARAFTLGEDIYFAAGAYDPHGSAGVELIAHEAAHVAQNRRGTAPAARGVSQPSDAHEHEAVAFGREFLNEYAGPIAHSAFDLIAAGSDAVRSAVALAEPTPQRDALIGSLDRVTAARDRVHRKATGKPTAPATPWTLADAQQRVEDFLAGLPARTPGKRVFADFKPKPKRFDKTSDRFRRSYYVDTVKAALKKSAPPDKDLERDLAAVHPVGVGGDRALVQVGGPAGGFWGWIARSEKPPADVDYLLEAAYKHRTENEIFQGYCATLASIPSLKPPRASLTFELNEDGDCNFVVAGKSAGEEAYTEDELKLCRDQIRKACLAVARYKMQDDQWQVFFDEVIEGARPKFPQGLQGDLFADRAAKDLGTTVKKQQVMFRDRRLNQEVEDRNADGIIDGKQLKLVEFKSGPASPGSPKSDSKLIQQAEDYAKILSYQIKATRIDPPDRDGPFSQVAYIFPTKEMSETWAPSLKTVFKKYGQQANLRVFPAAEGSGVATLKINPQFEVPLEDAEQTHHHIKNPMMLHPGLNFRELDLVTRAPGDTTVVSGTLAMDADLAGGIQGNKVTAKIQHGDGQIGVVENKLPRLTTSIDKILGRVTTEAKLVDDGVEATLTVKGGPSGIPKVNLADSTLVARYTSAGLAVSGVLVLATHDRSITGTVVVGWDGSHWTFKGTATVGKGLVDGLENFTVVVEYEGGHWKFGIDAASYAKQLGAVTLSGEAYGVRYDMERGDFSGLVKLGADLGSFGKAYASAELQHNQLERAEFSYDSPELRIPRDKDPVFTGTLGGTIQYSDGKLSGQIRGDVGVALPGLSALAEGGAVGLHAEVKLDHEGRYSGSIRSTTPLRFGKYFSVPRLEAKVDEEGNTSAAFELELSGIKQVKTARLGAHIDKSGLVLDDASVDLQFGDPDKDKVYGSVLAAYHQADGLTLHGDVSARVGKDMILEGQVDYNSRTDKATVEVTTREPIKILDAPDKRKTLFEFEKNIPLFGLPPLISLDLALGFSLEFLYGLHLGVTPKARIEDLDLTDLSFKAFTAEMDVHADLHAGLVGTPSIGLGFSVVSGYLLSGSAGIKVPVTALASLNTDVKVPVTYRPDGGLDAAASVGMSLDFGIDAAITPYAKLSILDGVYTPDWEGDPLARFTLMPRRQLFAFNLDFGGDMKKQEPNIPDRPPLAAKVPATTQLPASQASGERSVEGSPGPRSGKESGGGVGIDQLLGNFKGWGPYQTLTGLIEDAVAIWNKFKGVISDIKNGVKYVGGKIVEAGEWVADTACDVGSAIGSGIEDAWDYVF